MARVTHFEIAAQNPERAIKFYEGVFGWKFTKWQGPMEYWMIVTGPESEHGINGGLMRREKPMSEGHGPWFRCTIDVPFVDEYVDKVKAAGGSVWREKIAIPGIGWIAMLKDTEDNVFGLMQPDKEAK